MVSHGVDYIFTLSGAPVSSLYGAPHNNKGSHDIALDFTLGFHRYPGVFQPKFL